LRFGTFDGNKFIKPGNVVGHAISGMANNTLGVFIETRVGAVVTKTLDQLSTPAL